MTHEGHRSRGDLSLERAQEDLGQRFQLDWSLDVSRHDEAPFGSSRVIHPHDGLGFDPALQVRRRQLDLNAPISSRRDLARKMTGHPREREARSLEPKRRLAGIVDEKLVNDALSLAEEAQVAPLLAEDGARRPGRAGPGREE